MADSRDTFSAWLDVLVDTLDEHDLTGEQIARRLHLSRFHLDRIVSTSAGEAPSALRRRILLERSAFRLATSRRSVHDVAVEAGYGSHEAFTRAFRRAYGLTPSAWRAVRGRSVSERWPVCTSTRRAAYGSRPSRESLPWTSSRRWSSTTSG